MVALRLAAPGFALAGAMPALLLRSPRALDSKTGIVGPVAKAFLYSGDVSRPVIRGNALLIR